MFLKGTKVRLHTNSRGVSNKLQQLNEQTGFIIQKLSNHIYVVKVGEELYNIDDAYLKIVKNEGQKPKAYTVRENKKISDSELLVMKCVWDSGEGATCADVIESLKNMGYEYKATTIYTFLNHLKIKGHIDSYKKGKGVTYYKAKTSYDEYLRDFIKDTMNFWFRGQKELFVKAVEEV